MNEPSDNESLLSDILAEGPAGGLRESFLSETVLLARRRRRFRQTRRVASGLILLTAGLFLTFRHPPSPKSVQPESASPLPPLPPQPPPTGRLVENKPPPARPLGGPNPTTAALTTSSAAPRVLEITDEALLALAAP